MSLPVFTAAVIDSLAPASGARSRSPAARISTPPSPHGHCPSVPIRVTGGRGNRLTASVSPECLMMFSSGRALGGTSGGFGAFFLSATVRFRTSHFLPPPLSLTTVTFGAIRGGTGGGLGCSFFAIQFSLSCYGTPMTCSATATMDNASNRKPAVAKVFLQCNVFSSARSTSSFRCISTYAAISGFRFQSSF